MEGEENNVFTFVVSDESINKYGYRVLTEGIDLTEFLKNPVMLYNHHRSDDYNGNTGLLPVGRWDNIRMDDQKRLLMDAVLDTSDELGKKILSKVSQKMLNAASIGIGVVEVSEDPELLLEGQTRPTIKKSVLQEVSIVDIPANANAMRLSFSGVSLTLNSSSNMEQLNAELPEIKEGENKEEEGKELGASLGARIEELVAEYAEANEMTLEEVREAVGNAAGISASTVAQIESGEVNCPPLDRLEGFAEFFSVSMESLMSLAMADGCNYEPPEEEEETLEETEEELRNTFSTSVSGFLLGIKNSFKLVKREGVETGALSALVKTLKADLSLYNSDKETKHTEEIEELSSSLEILKAELDLINEKLTAKEAVIVSLKKSNQSLISGATTITPEKEAAPLGTGGEEEKELTKLELQMGSFNTLANKYFKKKNS